MISIARLPSTDREDLFTIAAQSMGVPPAIVEKDFWVCYVLDYLFNRSEFGTIIDSLTVLEAEINRII